MRVCGDFFLTLRKRLPYSGCLSAVLLRGEVVFKTPPPQFSLQLLWFFKHRALSLTTQPSNKTVLPVSSFSMAGNLCLAKTQKEQGG